MRAGDLDSETLRRVLEGAGPSKRPPMGRTLPATERAFQADVLLLALRFGWRRVHFRPGRVKRNGQWKYETPFDGEGKGFVDLLLFRERVVFAELKSEAGELRPEQKTWQGWLADAGAEHYVWRPSQWSEIERVLSKVAG